MRHLPLIAVALWALAAPALAAGPLDELRRTFALGGKPIPADVFRDFGAADLAECRRSSRSTFRRRSTSNRYGDPIVRNGVWVEQSRPAEGSINGAEEIGYHFIGATRNGLLIVVAYYSGGGTGVFYSLNVLDANLAAGFDGDGKVYRRVDLRCCAASRSATAGRATSASPATLCVCDDQNSSTGRADGDRRQTALSVMRRF